MRASMKKKSKNTKLLPYQVMRVFLLSFISVRSLPVSTVPTSGLGSPYCLLDERSFHGRLSSEIVIGDVFESVGRHKLDDARLQSGCYCLASS